MTGRVLLVDDDREMCRALEEALTKRGFDVTWRTTAPDALDLLRDLDVDVAVTDLRLHGMSGLELCERIVESRPDVPSIVITAFGTVEHAIGAIRAGACDFIIKPFETEALVLALERDPTAGCRKRCGRCVAWSRSPAASATSSAPARRCRRCMTSSAGSPIHRPPLLVTGEAEPGRRVVARALHERGPRKGKPF